MRRRILSTLVVLAAFTTAAAADEDRQLALANALHRKIAACWAVPADVPPHIETVRVKFSLTEAGELAGSPAIDAPIGGDPATKAFAASAVRAIVRCAPFPELKAIAPYAAWKTVRVTFKRPDM